MVLTATPPPEETAPLTSRHLQAAVGNRAQRRYRQRNELHAATVDRSANVGTAGEDRFLCATDNGRARRTAACRARKNQPTRGRSDSVILNASGPARPPCDTTSTPPLKIDVFEVRPPADTTSAPRPLVVLVLAMPLSVAEMPSPPAFINSAPPASTVAPMSVPPANTPS